MFQVVSIDDLPSVPWKNGGGLTREIAKREDSGRLIWRISVADVETDGPFSIFPKMTRILTVIQGHGIDLVTPDTMIPARLGEPIRFSGEIPVIGRLTKGPIRDLNIIFDPTRVTAEVRLFTPAKDIHTAAEFTAYLPLDASVQVDGTPLPVGSFAFGHFSAIDAETGARALLVRLGKVT